VFAAWAGGQALGVAVLVLAAVPVLAVALRPPPPQEPGQPAG
jgi:hypothetical protein